MFTFSNNRVKFRIVPLPHQPEMRTKIEIRKCYFHTAQPISIGNCSNIRCICVSLDLFETLSGSRERTKAHIY